MGGGHLAGTPESMVTSPLINADITSKDTPRHHTPRYGRHYGEQSA